MKKLFAFLLVFAMCFSLFACTKAVDNNETTTQADTPAQATEQETATLANDVTETVETSTTEVQTTAHTHSWKKATCTTPKICKDCGVTEGEAKGHSWSDATCTSPKKCKNCDATEGEAKGHTWSEATCTSPKKCTVCNATEGEAGNHNTNSNGICTICGNNAVAESYAYLAGSDFRSIRRDYSTATANGAYVVVFNNSKGETCVLTFVSYRIQNNYTATTLHNITTGDTVEEPFDYYNKLADRQVGQSKMYYMNMANDARAKELVAMQNYSDYLKTGTHSGAGAYVSAADLNL